MSPRSAPTSGKSGKPSIKKTAVKKDATKTPTPRPAPEKPNPSVKESGRFSPEDRMRLIAEAAYFKAERRGFSNGGELGDWFEAEAEVNALLDSRGAG